MTLRPGLSVEDGDLFADVAGSDDERLVERRADPDEGVIHAQVVLESTL
jgi:hypothetical protein